MRFGVIVFPGSNCDRDTYHVLSTLGAEVEYIWYRDSHTHEYEALVLPGGFSYGDYLRTGAIAATAPIMKSLREDIRQGKPVIGICNGFQILLESGLLPGALLTNSELKFICRDVFLRCDNCDTLFSSCLQAEQPLQMPIAHHTGNYFAERGVIEELEDEDRVLFRYCDANGMVSPAGNPNGSLGNIAGILNRQKNVLGMMPHPERAADQELGSVDGAGVFKSMLERVIA
ncbi:MAG: phosphoribosylformylglycinamidine synthase subunit PurQ [Candidatus Delongbacteria bacterium]|nr:phosphoribosylformylglycinamidine synthase subunit PurQ [bacterium]MBL7033039.1 phosphoribosylformylglycinamidine synthase subunit PurQ [Candidatus Delongbacteria bacterium]